MKKSYKTIKDFLNNSVDNTDVLENTKFYQKYLLSFIYDLIKYDFKEDSETITQEQYVNCIALKGKTAVIEKNGKLYMPFEGNCYGYDVNNYPTKYVYANPVLGSGEYEDGKKCAIIYNTSMDKNNYAPSYLLTIINKYARWLADIDSTINSCLIAQRAGLVGQAATSEVAEAMNEIINKLKAGDTKTLLNEDIKLNSFQTLQFNTSTSYNELTNLRDYILNIYFNTIGLNQLQEKRERLIETEVQYKDDLLELCINMMFKCAKENVEKVNKIFNRSWEVMKNEVVTFEEDEDDGVNEARMEEEEDENN